MLDDLYEGFFGTGDGHPKPIPPELYKFMQRLVKDGMRFPAAEGHHHAESAGAEGAGSTDSTGGAAGAAASPFLLPGEADVLQFTPDGTTRHVPAPCHISLTEYDLCGCMYIYRSVQLGHF